MPCGKCAACRLNKSSEWATRVVHEMQYCTESCFITLTYKDAPDGYSLVKKDVQDFMKRLRSNLSRSVKGEHGRIRSFFACGEYGTQKGRPHYHVLILGWQPHDLQYYKKSYSGEVIYTSPFLEYTWGKGFCPVGTCTNLSAGYVARYAKKVTGTSSSRVPEFMLSSRNIELSDGSIGGLGSQWFLDNWQELRHGYLELDCVRNVKLKIPEYYFKLAQRLHPEFYEQIKDHRYELAMSHTSGVSFGYDLKYDDFILHFDRDYKDAVEHIRSSFYLGPDKTDLDVIRYWKKTLRSCMVQQDKKIDALFLRHLHKSK